MKARCRARTNASYRADGCSRASRQSRMVFKTATAVAPRLVVKQTRRNAPFIVAPPCQSGIKRTLRRPGGRSKTRYLPGFCRCRGGSFSADGERRVSRTLRVWFRNGGGARRAAKAPSIENLRQIESVGFFVNFRRIKFNANTCDLSKAVSQGPIAGDQPQRDQKRTAGVARCFFCFAWHSGSGWCSCCCQETRRLNGKNCRKEGRPKPCRPRPRPCRT